MDYLVLRQREWQNKPEYLDVPGVIYHYPARYFRFINGFERFVYYRPQRGALAAEASTYFGYGTLSLPFADPADPQHRFVDIAQYQAFPKPVPYADAGGVFYESRYSSTTAFTGRSVQPISETDYFRIIAAAGLIGDPFAKLESTEKVILSSFPITPMQPPRQPFRDMPFVARGTGYQPSGNVVDVYESAALQERARADHQRVLRVIHERVMERGGTSIKFNNNVDMFAVFPGKRLLIEAKSLNAPHVAIDRMRYGMGQLADYAVRYRPDFGEPERVLAFGKLPTPEIRWIGTILEENEVAFVGLSDEERLVPLNLRAENLPLFK